MKLFVLLSRIPYPLEKGDKLRAWHQLKKLNEKHEVFLCCLHLGKIDPEAEQKLKEISSHYAIVRLEHILIPFYLFFSLFTGKPFQVAYFFQWGAFFKVRRHIESFAPDHIYCQLLRTAEYAKDLKTSKKTLDYQDCFSAGMSRREKRSNWPMNWLWASEKRRLARYEFQAFEMFDHKTIISVQDRNGIPHSKNQEITIVPNGVDLKNFTPLHSPKTTDLLFTGNMSYPPNVETAIYLVEKILPQIRREIPNVTLTICGAEPVKVIRDMASAHVKVTGWVKDIAAIYHSTRIFIAPMQMGAGLQNKLLEAMACGIPCITSQLAGNALMDSPEQAFIIGTSPEDYASKVIKLLKNADERERMAQLGRSFVMENYTWEQAVKPLELLIETV